MKIKPGVYFSHCDLSGFPEEVIKEPFEISCFNEVFYVNPKLMIISRTDREETKKILELTIYSLDFEPFKL